MLEFKYFKIKHIRINWLHLFRHFLLEIQNEQYNILPNKIFMLIDTVDNLVLEYKRFDYCEHILLCNNNHHYI